MDECISQRSKFCSLDIYLLYKEKENIKLIRNKMNSEKKNLEVHELLYFGWVARSIILTSLSETEQHMSYMCEIVGGHTKNINSNGLRRY